MTKKLIKCYKRSSNLKTGVVLYIGHTMRLNLEGTIDMNKKLILFMTSLSLAVSPMSVMASEYTGPKATIEAVEDRATLKAATGEYKTWKQYDSRWSRQLMGEGGDTMAASGCLVTAIAMLMVHSGAADEYGVDPGKLCTYLSNNKGFTGNSELYWAQVNGAVSGFRLANYSVKLEGSRYDKAAKIKRYLDAGQYVVVSVGNNAHWVAVNYADDEGNVYIFDPGYSYTSLFGSYNDAGIINMATFTSTGNGNGNINVGNGNQSSNANVENYKAMGTVDVGASYLNVRAGLGTDKDYLKDGSGNRVTLKDGAEVEITGKGKDSSGSLWYRISVNGLTGYVYGAYIDVDTEKVEGQGKPAKVSGSYVYVRTGAGTAYDTVGALGQNTAITVYESKYDSQNNMWYKIKSGNIIGYMRADFIQLDGQEVLEETTYDASKPGKVNAAAVYVRKAAGYDKATAATLTLNSKVTVLGEVKTSDGTKWYKVKYDGGEGYMVAEYITITNDDTAADDYTETKNGVVNEDWINVRAGAGTNHAVKTSLRKDTAVTIVGEGKDGSGTTWYKIKYAGGEGYMRHDFITVKEAEEDKNEDNNNNTNTDQKSGKVNTNSVNVRSGAGTNNRVVGNLSSGTAVTIVGEGKDSSGATWYKIKYTGGEGYMRHDFITLDNAGSNDNANTDNNGGNGSSASTINGKVNGNSVNVRKGAGTNNAVVKNVNAGFAVIITGEDKDASGAKWYKVTFNGGEGYIHSNYVTITNAPATDGGSDSTPSTPSYEQKTGKVNQDWVNVRAGAGTNHAARTSLRKDTAVTITGEEKDSAGATWYKITHSGGTGYMRSDFITIGSGNTGNTNNNTGSNSTESTDNNAGSSNAGSSNTGSNVNVPTEGVAGKEGIVNQPIVNVRKSPDANAEILLTIDQNVSVFIETATKDSAGIVWYKVSFAGEIGYMMGQFLTVK